MNFGQPVANVNLPSPVAVPSQSDLLPPFDHVRPADSVSWYEVFKRRDDLPDQDGAGRRVCVVGAGIAGLVVALELRDRRFDVTVLEASDRVGGRIRTHRFGPSTYGELGAMRVPFVHAATMHYVNRFRLATRLFPNWNPKRTLFFNGVKAPVGPIPDPGHENVSDPIGGYLSRLSRAFPGLQRVGESGLAAGPLELLRELVVEPLVQSLGGDEGLWDLLKPMPSQRARRLQGVALVDYVTGPEVGLSRSDWTYLSRATGTAPLGQCSPVQFLIDMLPVMSTVMVEIVGGMDTLAASIANALHQAIHVKARVERVAVGNDGTTVSFEQRGERTTEAFDAVFITVPPRALSRITLSAPSPLSAKLQAVRQTRMGPLAKTLFVTRKPFWVTGEEGDEGGLSCTDLGIRQTWFPRTDPAEPPTGGYVFTASYRWGEDAFEFASLTDDARTEGAIEDLALMHGMNATTIRRLLLAYTHHFWEEGYTILPTREGYVQYLEAIQAPVQDAQGRPRVYFAGEHVGTMHGWMVSAIQPALKAVRDFLASIASSD